MKKLSVLIPSYRNTYDEIKKTLDSIPTYIDVLVVDDGSDVSVSDTLNYNICSYPNVMIHRIENNMGIENALKVGVDFLVNKYEFIARLDIGDENESDRFDLQLKALEDDSELVMVGSWASFIDADGKFLFTRETPVHDDSIRKRMYLNNMFIHPSVVIRSSAILLAGNYNDKYKACEDYDLFFRVMAYGKVKNLPKALIKYEVSDGSISSRKRLTQVFNRIRIILSNFEVFKFGFYPYYGLLRNVIILFINRGVTTNIRKILGK